MPYFLINFDIKSSKNSQRYPLPGSLDLAVLDESFALTEQCRVAFSDIKDPSVGEVLRSWGAVIEAVVSVLSQTDDRALIFPSRSHLDLFHIIKQKCKLHTKSNGNAFFERRSVGDGDSYAGANEASISFDDMISAVQMLGAESESESEHPGYLLNWIQKKKPQNVKAEKQTSYKYMGDTRTNVFHELKSACLSEIPKDNLRGLGKDPRKVGFTACATCLQGFTPPALPYSTTRKPQVHVSKKPLAVKKSKLEIMREQIKRLSEEYGMHAEFHGSRVYITTVAGEWYFDYNNRPIRLRHKNAEKWRDRNGKLIGHFHTQPYQFHAPLQVLAYIRNHERLEVQRSLETEQS
jgi:hypothetical protein